MGPERDRTGSVRIGAKRPFLQGGREESTDRSFSRDCRVRALRLHPTIAGSDDAYFPRTAAEQHRLPASERRNTAIFTGNYGEAGAIDVLGRRLRLRAAYSAHNGFSEWRIPPVTGTHTLLVGFDNATAAAPYFDQCRTLATVNNRVGLNNNEHGPQVML
jgi:hypothetical protein